MLSLNLIKSLFAGVFVGAVVATSPIFVNKINAIGTPIEEMKASLAEYYRQTGADLSHYEFNSATCIYDTDEQCIAYNYGYANAMMGSYLNPEGSCRALSFNEQYSEEIQQGCLNHFEDFFWNFGNGYVCPGVVYSECKGTSLQYEAIEDVMKQLDDYCVREIGDCRYFWQPLYHSDEVKRMYESRLAFLQEKQNQKVQKNKDLLTMMELLRGAIQQSNVANQKYFDYLANQTKNNNSSQSMDIVNIERSQNYSLATEANKRLQCETNCIRAGNSGLSGNFSNTAYQSCKQTCR